LAEDDTAMQLMAEYDVKLPAAEISTALRLAARGDAAAGDEALAALELDHRLRAAISQRYGYSPADLELILGRDLIQVARGHGLVPELDKDDNPRLVKAV
jgi:hypothetical protein